ncbi:MAG: LysR family transcriptional regulator, partial [Chromatiales bacterium]
ELAQSRLNVTQSTISAQMAKLESRLGYRLCERGRGGFRLTTKGQHVLVASRALLDAVNDFLVEAQEVAGRLVGELRVGLADNIGGNPSVRLDAALARFRDRAADVTLNLVVDEPQELERRVLGGELHVAVSHTAKSLPGLAYRHLFDEPQAVYCSRRHPFFSLPDSRIGEAELEQAQWVDAQYTLPRERDLPYTKGARATADHVDAILQLVLSGQFIGYLPAHYADPWVAREELRALHERLFNYSIEFFAITRRTDHPGEVLSAFLEDLFAIHRSDSGMEPSERGS